MSIFCQKKGVRKQISRMKSFESHIFYIEEMYCYIYGKTLNYMYELYV